MTSIKQRDTIQIIQKMWGVHWNQSKNHHGKQWHDDTTLGRVSPGVSRAGSLHFVCHSWNWLSYPPACRETKAVYWHERAEGARWEGWAHMSGEGEAAGVPSLPPADHTGQDSTSWHMVPPRTLGGVTIWWRVVAWGTVRNIHVLSKGDRHNHHPYNVCAASLDSQVTTWIMGTLTVYRSYIFKHCP